MDSATLDLDLTYAIAQARTTDDLRSAAEQFATTHDFAYWAYALSGPDRALTNYPAQLVATYIEKRWHCGCDPLVNAIHRCHRSLSWELESLACPERPLDATQRHVIDCRWEVGARAGVSAPAYGRRGSTFEFAIMSFSRDRPLSDVAKRDNEPRVQLIAAYFLSVAQQIFACAGSPPPTEPVVLTQRERDCLSWAAIGKSSWAIGQLLGISAATVNFHLTNAAAKLGVYGRVCAVAQAIRVGLINPV